MKMIVRNPT